MDNCKKNEYKLYISNALYCAMMLMVTGAILQSVMLHMGLSEKMVSSAVGVFQLVQGSVMILASPLTDRIKKVVKVCAWLMLSPIPMLGVLILLCSGAIDGSMQTVYCMFIVAGCISNLILGVYNVLSYKKPFHIINMKDYGRITANESVIIGVVGMLFSTLLTFCLGKFNYLNVVLIFACVGFFMVGTAFFTANTFKEIGSVQVPEKKESASINLLKYKPFYALLLPNITRGIATGIFGISVTIGYNMGILTSVSGSYLAVGGYIASIVGGIVYAQMEKKFKNGKIVLISSIATFVFLGLMLPFKNTVMFIIMYTAAYIVIYAFDMAIPVNVSEIVDYRYMGRYTAWRMMTHTIGSAIGSFITPFLLGTIGGMATLVFSGVLRLVTGFGYYLYNKKEAVKH